MANKKEVYLYISSFIRAREPRMLSRDKAERMLEAPSFEESAKILTDCGYEDMSQMRAKDIDKALAKHRDKVFSELASLAPNKSIVDIFRIKYDYHNAKVVIKAEAVNSDESGLLSGSGRVKPEELLAACNEDRCKDLPGRMGAAVEEARQTLARTGNPQLADFILDRAYFAELEDLAVQMDSKYLKGYVAVLVDSSNLRSAVRTLRMGKDADFMASALVPGGNVSCTSIMTSASGEGLAALFANTGLKEAAALGAAATEGGTLTAFERACDNAVMAYVCDAKLKAYGEEPVIAYMAAVESEITTARIILTGRLAGIAADVLRERLRDMYA